MKRVLNKLLLFTFVLTILVPVTGIHIHKLSSTIFLLLCIVHTVMNWNEMNVRRYLVLGLVAATFVSGIFGMILEEYTWILTAHKMASIGVVFFLAIHIFIFKNRI